MVIQKRSSLTFKLKQASAVLGVPPKDLQNLVQLGVIRPARRKSVCWFDLPCSVKVGQNNGGYKTIEEFLPEAAA